MWLPEDELTDECRWLPRDRNPTKLMVWCGISFDGRTGIHVYEPGTKIKAAEYISCLEDCLLPAIDDREYLFPNGEPKKWVFMQDGAPAHRAKKTTKWRAKHLTGDGAKVATPSVQVDYTNGGNVNKWPANSPDLNPIQNLWTQFQDAVAKSDPRTTDEFKKVLKAAWWAIPQDRIRCLYNSMPQRLQAVVANGGKWTKY